MSQILSFRFFYLVVSATALRLHQSQSSLSTARSLYKQKCISQANERIHPLVKLIAEWFPKHDFHAYPTALTALSAMRFGGIEMSFGRKNRTFDDDIDFMLVPDLASHIDLNIAAIKVRAFASEVQKVLGHRTRVMALPSPILAKNLPEAISRKVDFLTCPSCLLVAKPDDSLWHVVVWVDTLSEVTDVQDPVSKRFDDYFFNGVSLNRSIEGEFCCSTTQTTQLDFWIDVSGRWLTKKEVNAIRKPLLLAGVAFDSPWSDDVHAENFRMVTCAEWGKNFSDFHDSIEGRQAVKSFCEKDSTFCDFFRPAFSGYDMRILSDDFSQRRVQKTFAACAATLDHDGYRSFSKCK